jgi:hypothetical protein
MPNPTTNYGFVLPTPTDLVTDLPADFEVALQGVDTQMKTNADAATQKATLTTKGDIYAATGTSTPARLAVGTNGQVLTADSSASTGLAWTAVATDKTFTLLNTGGTALTGAPTVTITGITSEQLLIVVTDASSNTANDDMYIRFNSDTGSNYAQYGVRQNAASNTVRATQAGRLDFAGLSTNAASVASAAVFVTGCKSTTRKPLSVTGMATTGGGSDPIGYIYNGFYNASAAITSVTVGALSGNLDGGTVFIYGAN